MAHEGDIQIRDRSVISRSNVIPRSLLLAVICQRFIFCIQKLQPGQNVKLAAVQLFLYQFLLLGFFGDVLDKRMGIADRAGHHAGDGILILPDHTHDFQFKSVVVKSSEPKFLSREIDIAFRFRIILVHIRRENIAKAHIADLLIAPALDLCFHRFLRYEGLHVIRDRGRRFQAKRVQHQIRDLIVLVDDQDRFIVILRPFSIENIVLLLQHGIDCFPVFAREHLLPDIYDRIIGTVGREEGTVIPAVHAAHRGLHQLNHICLGDVSVYVLSIQVHIQVVGILN